MAAGATLINDISASLCEVAAATGAGWVAMHMQGEPRTMQDDPRYDDVVAEVRAFVLERARRPATAGVAEVWVDPGIGFGKTIDHNLSLLRHLGELVDARPTPAVPASSSAPAASASSASWPPAPRTADAGPRPSRTASRARWPPRPRPWSAGRAWSGSTTWRPTVQVARLYGPAA